MKRKMTWDGPGSARALTSCVMLVAPGACLATTAYAAQDAFSHALHEAIACDDCHAGARTSDTGRDELVPGSEEACLACHEPAIADAAAWSRAAGHHPEFSHAAHMRLGKARCEACHGAAAAEPLTHETCFTCHREEDRTGDCAACHADLAARKPADHAGGFLHTHAFEARSGASRDCQACHRQSQLCLDCHQGENVSFLAHPRDYVFTHPQEARTRYTECASCHDTQTFCGGCHVAENVLPGDHTASDWWNAGGGFHAEEARADLGTCLSCHDTGGEPTCARCHGP